MKATEGHMIIYCGLKPTFFFDKGARMVSKATVTLTIKSKGLGPKISPFFQNILVPRKGKINGSGAMIMLCFYQCSVIAYKGRATAQ